MKRIFILGAFTLISTTLLSCTADEYTTTDNKATLENEPIRADNTVFPNEDQGPGDQPIVVPIPKK